MTSKTFGLVLPVAGVLLAAVSVITYWVQAEPSGGGICCLLPGECQLIDEASCTGMGGIFPNLANTSCQNQGFNCDPGACCLPDGTCAVRIEWWCENVDGGAFIGSGITCAEVGDCTLGACCRPDGFCETTAEWDCLTIHAGIWRGPNTVCGDFNQNGTDDACETFCPWDLNRNGTVDVPDLLTLLANWGACPVP